jgi:hypothetical protein
VIRTVALGIVCLAALGAIAAAAKKSTLPQSAEVVFPVVAGDKADRLPRMTRGDTLTDAEKVEISYVAPAEDRAPRSAPQKAASPPSPRLVSRHWHDPHDRKFFEANKPKADNSRPAKKNVAERASKQASNVKECRSDGLDPILRKLNLSPACE